MLETEVKFGEVHDLLAQIENGTDRVHFKQIFSNDNGGVSLVAFKAGQFLDEHVAPAEVMVYVIEGDIDFAINGEVRNIKAGHFLLMGADVRHSVKANADSKLVLIKVKP